jgi:hypothetical protein
VVKLVINQGRQLIIVIQQQGSHCGIYSSAREYRAAVWTVDVTGLHNTVQYN